MSTEDKQLTNEDADELFKSMYNDTPEPEVKEPEVVEEVEEVKEEAPPVEEVTTEKKEVPKEEDPLAWLQKIEDEELRKKAHDALNEGLQYQHKYKSDEGRIAALQNKTFQLQKRLADLTQSAPTKPAPATADVPATPEEWTKLLDNDPLAAKAVEARVKQEVDALRTSFQNEIQVLKQSSIDPIHNERIRVEREQEEQALDQMTGGYWRHVKSTPMFQGWLAHEADEATRWAAQNSYDRNDAMAILNNFADTMLRTGRAQAIPQVSNQAATPVQTNAEEVTPQVQTPNKADSIAAARADKLSKPAIGSAAISPSPSAGKTGPLDDKAQEALFKELYESGNL